MNAKEPKALIAEICDTGATQEEVAKAMGLTQSSVSKLARGKYKEMRSSAFIGLMEMHQRVVKPARRSAQPKAAA